MLWRALILVAGLHVYWLLGGTWGVHAGSGGAYSEITSALRVYSAVVAVLLIVGGLVVRARVGLWRAPLSDQVVRVRMWLLTACLGLAALLNFGASTNVERFVIAPFVLLLTLLGLVIAASGRASGPASTVDILRSRRTEERRYRMKPTAEGQQFLSDRTIQLLAWALAGIFLLETLAGFTWSRDEWGWWMYGPVSLVIAALALAVAGSGGLRRPHRTSTSHFT